MDNRYNSSGQRRNPYAKNSYKEYKQYRAAKRDDRISSVRYMSLIAAATLVLINLVFMAVSGGQLEYSDYASIVVDNSKNRTDESAAASPTDEPVVTVNSAYGRIVQAEGDYDWLINKYITYERGAMQSDEVVMSFTGDCTLGTWPTSSNLTNYNTIYESSGSPTYSFDNVKSFFANDDYTYINLETTLTTSNDRYKDKTYNFKGDPEWASSMLAASYIDGCTLANNHSYDYCESGYNETISVLEKAGLDVGDQDMPVICNLNGLEVVLINGNYIWEKVQLPQYLYGDDLTQNIIDQIKKYKRDDNIVIACCHWGLERQNMPDYSQYDPARKFIDAGADMVIGHHPHTCQTVELYNGKYIFYSLGNFAFGGKASTDKVNRISMLLRPRFALRDGVAQVTGVMVVPCWTTSAANNEVNDYRPRPLYGADAKALGDEIISFSAYTRYGIDSLEFPTANFTS